MPRSRIYRALLHRWQVSAVFLAALGLYLWRVGTPALWTDEAATANETARSGRSLLAFLADRDAVLGPYYAAMHLWQRVGDGEWWLRLPSVLAMALAAALVAALASRWWGQNAGLAAGLLFVAVPLTTRYAQEARPYAMAIACTLLAVWALTRAVQAPRRRRWWAAYAVAVSALGLSHLVALLTVLAHPVLLGRRRVRRRWLTWLGIGLVPPTVLLAVALGQRERLGWIPEPTPRSLAEAYLEIGGGSTMLALLGALALVGLPGNRRWPALAVWFVLPPLVLAALGTWTPVFTARYLLVCAPALVLAAAAGLRRGRWWQAVGVALFAFALSLPQHLDVRQPDGHGPNVRAAARIIAGDCTRPPTVREGSATLQALPYYLRRAGCEVRWLPQAADPAQAGVDRLWLVRPDWAEAAAVPGYQRIATENVSGLRLTLWQR